MVLFKENYTKNDNEPLPYTFNDEGIPVRPELVDDIHLFVFQDGSKV